MKKIEKILGINLDHLEQNIHRGEFAKLFANGKLKVENIWAEIGDIISGKKTGRTLQKEKM